VLERVARIDLALLDKTGTLTRGEPRLVEVVSAPGQRRERILRLAAGIEERSNHAYASTVRQRAAEQSLKPMKVTGISDEEAGVSGRLKAKQVRFGREDWIVSLGIEVPELLEAAVLEAHVAGRGMSLLTEDDAAIALFVFEHDDLREGAGEMVDELRRQGIAVELLSGDSQSAVEALGERLGIAADSCRGEISPEGKAIWVQRRSRARRTLMAGDGFNDAAALAAADVGVAVGSGEQVNLDAADVLIPSEDPRQLSSLIRLSRRTRMIVLANILLSFLVTVTLVVSVLDGWHTSLALGVFVHEASALLVLLNGIWLADAGMSRLGMLGGLFVSLWSDVREAFGKLWHQRLASIR
jgi:P-type E1-E2 ATPase